MTLILHEITKRYREQTVVSHVSIEVPSGEFFVLLGTSGSGKSTLLRIIAGLTTPDSGTVSLDGRDLAGVPPQKRNFGFLFQNYALFRHMTVAKNIEFGLSVRRVPRVDRARRREELLDLVGLAGLGDRYPDQLSGGQRQRVALARALAYQPSLLLLDEPFGALDLRIRGALRKNFREIQRTLGITTVMVTHDQEEAFELGDRIAVLERGKLAEIGTPSDLYQRPRTEFVANFIGGGNVLVGRADRGGVTIGKGIIPLPARAPVHEDGAPVRLLFRPEQVKIQTTPFSGKGGVHSIGEGRLRDLVFAGAFERLRFEMVKLEGLRAAVPAVAFGQRYALVEALWSPTESMKDVWTDQTYWLGITGFHVLQPSSLRLLAVCCDGGVPAESVDMSVYLGAASHGMVSVLLAAPSEAEAAVRREELERVLAQSPSHAQLRTALHVRIGEGTHEVVFEAQEYHYDIVILPHELRAAHLNLAARRLLHQVRVPVLLVAQGRTPIRRILVCTAAGEPGKRAIKIGARIATHTGAAVTLLHIWQSDQGEEERQRIERHLMQGQAVLDNLNLKNDLRMLGGDPLETIVQQILNGDYDLTVVGASPLSPPGVQPETEVGLRLLRAARRPVLVVPMATE